MYLGCLYVYTYHCTRAQDAEDIKSMRLDYGLPKFGDAEFERCRLFTTLGRALMITVDLCKVFDNTEVKPMALRALVLPIQACMKKHAVDASMVNIFLMERYRAALKLSKK